MTEKFHLQPSAAIFREGTHGARRGECERFFQQKKTACPSRDVLREGAATQIRSIQHRRGFTLIEGIISIGIIGSALIVGLTLAYSNLQAAQANTDRILATHLAREGIEVIRNMRDSNWIRRDKNIDKNNDATDGFGDEPDFYDWFDLFDGWPAMPSTCLSDGSCYAAYFDVVLNDISFASGPYYTLAQAPENTNAIGCLNPVQQQCRVQKDSVSGVYYQSVVGESYTPFYRRIIIEPICIAENGPAIDDDDLYVNPVTSQLINQDCETPPSGVAPVGALITSHVVWQRGGKTLEIKFKERLYNWRNL